MSRYSLLYFYGRDGYIMIGAELLTCSQVQAAFGIGKSTIYRWMDTNQFPRPVKLGPNRVAWKKNDLTSWFEKRS